MYVVYKMKHYYADDSDVEIIAVCGDKKRAKQISKEKNGEFKEVPYYG